MLCYLFLFACIFVFVCLCTQITACSTKMSVLVRPTIHIFITMMLPRGAFHLRTGVVWEIRTDSQAKKRALERVETEKEKVKNNVLNHSVFVVPAIIR